MGHLIRSLEIVRGLTAFDVCFLNGGESLAGFAPPPHAEVINLPPIKSDADFRELHSADGLLSLEEVREARRDQILAAYERFRPDVLVIEMFPFGRRKFAFELLPLLERAKSSRTKVVCSLRDILVGKRNQQRFEEEVCQTIRQYFDLVLVHSDPRFQRLEETFSRTTELECPVIYTGFVAQPVTESETTAEDDLLATGGEQNILVSIGGGRVGGELVHCAIKAGGLIGDRLPHRLLIFAGPYMAEAEFQQLQLLAADHPGVVLRRYTTRFLSLLRRVDLSISMAGYNTCMNLVITGTRAIVCPFIGNDNQEQTIRAGKLQALGLVDVIHPDELEPELLAEKILFAFSRPRPTAVLPALDVNGVAATAAAINNLMVEGRESSSEGTEV